LKITVTSESAWLVNAESEGEKVDIAERKAERSHKLTVSCTWLCASPLGLGAEDANATQNGNADQ
jgi:hypothetical protein